MTPITTNTKNLLCAEKRMILEVKESELMGVFIG